MVEFLKYLRGYLRIRVSGFSPERFMNLCSNKGILLWKIVKEGDVYYMNINLKGFRALAHCQEDRNQGSRIGTIWAALFSAQAVKKEGFCGRASFCRRFLDVVLPVHMGYRTVG